MSEDTQDIIEKLGKHQSTIDALWHVMGNDYYEDPYNWRLCHLMEEGIFREKDDIRFNNPTNGKLQFALIAIADAAAESFLQRIPDSQDLVQKQFSDDKIVRAWTDEFEETTTFDDPRQAIVWFTWDIMAPYRFPDKRFNQLAFRALNLFYHAENLLRGYEEHTEFAKLLADCAHKLGHEMSDKDGRGTGLRNFPKPQRPKLD